MDCPANRPSKLNLNRLQPIFFNRLKKLKGYYNITAERIITILIAIRPESTTKRMTQTHAYFSGHASIIKQFH